MVHYTSAEVALNILKQKNVWMRNSKEMTDFSEIKTGTGVIKAFFDPHDGNKSFFENIEKIRPGLIDQITQSYNIWLPEIENNTFLFCVSEHDKKEDDFGRLSMWRGYGGNTGVAVVLNSDPFLSETITLGAFSYPALYDSHVENFREITELISNNISFLSQFENEILAGKFVLMLLSFAFCLKHQAFNEEKEWRVVFVPALSQTIRDGSHLRGLPLPITPSKEIVRGKPQMVYKILLEELRGVNESDTFNIKISNLIKRVIIGPCKNSKEIKQAFVEELTNNGVKNAENLVHNSGIPLRGI